MTEFKLIGNDDELEDFVNRQRSTCELAIDTEFVREKTFFPKLCLVQLATRGELVCVDVLGINNLAILSDLMFNPGCLKILHAGSQDLEVLYQALGRVPAPLFDTQLAAGFCGFRDQLGYGDLAEALCDIKLEKAHARFDWTTRPLPEKVLAYAADDVRYLLPIYEQLRAKLSATGRENWQQAESALLTDTALYDQPVDNAWTRIRGMHRLTDTQWSIACTIAIWREATAQRENRPRQWVIRNETILEIAQLEQCNRKTLKAITAIPGRYVQNIVTAISLAPTRSQNRQREKPPNRLDDLQRAMVRKLLAEIDKLGTDLDIAPTTLATRRDVETLVRGDSTGRLLSGWRRKVIGDRLLELVKQE